MASLFGYRISLVIFVLFIVGFSLWWGSTWISGCSHEICDCEPHLKQIEGITHSSEEDGKTLVSNDSSSSPLPLQSPKKMMEDREIVPSGSLNTTSKLWPHYELNQATPCVYLHFLHLEFALQDYWITDHLFGKIECGVRFLIEPFASLVTEVPSIYIWMGGISELQQIVDSGKVDEMRKRGVKRVGIHHMFDEACNHGDMIKELYPKFDFVIREFECQNEMKVALEMKIPFVMTPLGQMKCFGTPLRNSITRSSLRTTLLFFAGQPQQESRLHLRQLKEVWDQTLSPNMKKHIMIRFSTGFGESVKSMTRTQYRLLIRDSVFCLLGGRGGHWETWRMFEALASGCIPIIDYGPGACGRENENCGSHLNYPEGGEIPWFVMEGERSREYYEEDLRKIIDQYRDPVMLDRLQSRLYLWWRGYVEHFTTQIRDAVVGDMDLNSITTEQSDMISGGYSHMLDLKPNEGSFKLPATPQPQPSLSPSPTQSHFKETPVSSPSLSQTPHPTLMSTPSPKKEASS